MFGIHRYAISYQYALALLLNPSPSDLSGADNLLALAPDFSSINQKGARIQLDTLHYNREEIEQLQALTEGTFWVGEKATEARFVEAAPDYRVLHLATHAQANDTTGVYSFLAFTPLPDSVENEFLYVRDLYNMRLQADLVVLSACETGVGEWQRGEGIVSLGRGFLYAGARSIVTTLWNIDDQPTSEIMQAFYQRLASGMQKDEALREAKLSYLRNNSSMRAHPAYWAGFIGIGDMKAVSLDPPASGWYFWVVLAGVFLVGLGLWWKFRA